MGKGALRIGLPIALAGLSVALPFLMPVTAGAGAFGLPVFGSFLTTSLLTRLGLGLAIGSILSSTLFAPSKPKTQSFGGGGSPTYGFDGIQNGGNEDSVIPIVFGECRTGGTIINQFTQTEADKETYLYMLLALSEGSIEGISGIEINGNPIANFTDVTTYTRLGTSIQTIIPEFATTYNTGNVGQTINTGSSYTYTTSGSNLEVIMLNFAFPQGLYHYNKKGALERGWADIKVEYRVSPSGSWATFYDSRMSLATTSAYRSTMIIKNLAPNKYDVKVTKVNAPSDGTTDKNEFQWTNIGEGIVDGSAYPYLALLGLRIKASGQLSGSTPNVTALVKGKNSIDDLQDPATAVWTDNAPLILNEIFKNTIYGLGNYVTNFVNNNDIVIARNYADTLVNDGGAGTERRFRFDYVIDQQYEVADLIEEIANNFHGMVYYSQGEIRVALDKDDTTITQVFNMTNIEEGSYQEDFATLKERYNSIQLNLVDRTNNFQKITVVKNDDSIISSNMPERRLSVDRLAISRISQATREANYLLNSITKKLRTISFVSSLSTIESNVGDLISFQHDAMKWHFGGRIKSATTTSITINDKDADIVLSGGIIYKIRTMLSDGTIEEKTISDGAGTYRTVNVSSAFTSAPPVDSVWLIRDNAVTDTIYRVIGVKREKDNKIRLVATLYDSTVYTDVTVLPDGVPPPQINPNQIPPEIEDLVVTERKDTIGAIIVAFNPPTSPIWKYAEIDLGIEKDDDPSIVVYQLERSVSTKQDIMIGGLLPNRKYYVKVYSVSYAGVRSINPPVVSITLKSEPFRPKVVSGLEIVGKANGTTFGGKDVKFVWRRSGIAGGAGIVPAGKEPSGAEGAYNDNYFKDFRIEIWVGGVRKRVEYSTTPSYIYTYEKNVEDNNNVASRDVQIRVWERNIFNQESSYPAVLSVSNTAPTMAGFSPTLTPVLNSVQVDWSNWARSDIDLDKFEIYADTTNPPTTKRGEVSSSFNNFWIPTLTPDTLYYIKVKPFDSFGAGTDSSIVSNTTGGLSTKSTLAMRGVTVEGLDWTVNQTPNRADWPSFVIRWKGIDGTDKNVTISASNVTWTTGTLYIYWTENATTLSTTTNALTALADGNMVLATYKGGKAFISGEGFAIPATYIVTAMIEDLAVNDAKIVSLSAGKITASSVLANLIGVGDINRFLLDGGNTNIVIKDNQVSRVKLGKTGVGTTDYGLQIWNSAGILMYDLTGASTQGIQDNAVSINGYFSNNATVGPGIPGTWEDIGSVAVTAMGGKPLTVLGKATVYVNTGTAVAQYRIIHNESGTVMDSTFLSFYAYNADQLLVLHGVFTPGSSGTATFKLQHNQSGSTGGLYAYNRRMSVIENKK